MSKFFLESEFDFLALSKTVDFISFIQTINDESVYGQKIADAEIARNTQALKENVEALIGMGVPAEKMSIGLNLEGTQFKIDADKEGKPSSYEKMIGYNEICGLLSDDHDSNWKRTFFENSDVANLNNDKEHRSIVFDSSRSIANKVRFATKLGLAGVLVSPINNDDFLGQCEEDKETYIDFEQEKGVTLNIPQRKSVLFPLLRTISEAFHVTLDEIRQEKKSTPSDSKESELWDSDAGSEESQPGAEGGENKDETDGKDNEDDKADNKDEKEKSQEDGESEEEDKPQDGDKEEEDKSEESNKPSKPQKPQKPTNGTTQGSGNGAATHFTYNSICMISVMVVGAITSLAF